MNALYDLKFSAILFLASVFLIQFGALFKIRHWPYADELITIGYVISGAAIIRAIIKIAFLKKPGNK